MVVEHIRQDVIRVKDANTIAVKDHWADLERLSDKALLAQFHSATADKLLDIAAPLMRWVDIRGHEDAHRLDEQLTLLQAARLANSGEYADLQNDVKRDVENLPKNLNPVKAKADAIKQVRDPKFWAAATVADLEALRLELRQLMQFKLRVRAPAFSPREIDVADSDEGHRETHTVVYEGRDARLQKPRRGRHSRAFHQPTRC